MVCCCPGAFRLLIPLAAFWLAACSRPVLPPQITAPKPAEALTVEKISGTPGGTLVLAATTEPRTLNPLVAEDLYSSLIIGRILSGLTEYDWKQRRITPALAKDWIISEDHCTYTFHLRKGIQWSDGQPITADDVIFTFDAIFDPKVVNRYSEQFTFSTQRLQYRKVDDFTVEFTTPSVYAPFLNDVGEISILPKHVFSPALKNGTLSHQYTIGQTGSHPDSIVCSGPFKIKSFRSGERIVLERNPFYWKFDTQGTRLPYLDFHIVKFVQDPNTSMLLFGTGAIDVVGISPTDLGWLRKKADLYHYQIKRQGTRNGISFLWFNQHPGTNKDGKPYVIPYKLKWFTDKRFRQAILYGYDRQGIIDALLLGCGQPLHSPIPPCKGDWYNPSVKKYPYNPKRAKALLLSAGFRYRQNGQLEDRDGNLVNIKLLASKGGGPSGDAMDTAFVENMKAIGIAIKLVPVDFGTMIIKTGDSYDYEMASMGWGGGNDEPSGSKGLFMSNGRFHVWYPNQKKPATPWEARVDHLFEQQLQTLNRTQRVKLMHEIQSIYAEELPLIFNIIQDTYYGVSNRIQNLKVPAMGSPVWNIDELWIKEPDAR